MKSLLRKKLHKKGGETITEVLVALLITSFAALILAGAVGTAQRVNQKNAATLKKYYENSNNLAARTVPETGEDEDGETPAGVTGDEGVVKIYYGEDYISLNSKWDADGADVEFYICESGNTPVIAYETDED